VVLVRHSANPVRAVEVTARKIFLLAIEQQSPKSTEAVVDLACGSDAALRSAVQRLLNSRHTLTARREEASSDRLCELKGTELHDLPRALHQLALFHAGPSVVISHLSALLVASVAVGIVGSRTFRFV
jgi:hypothetical protein